MGNKPIDELLNQAFPGGVPENVGRYFGGYFQTVEDRRRTVRQIETEADAALSRDRQRLAELSELKAEHARHLPKYQALKARLSRPQLRIEPAEVGAMLADMAGCERVMFDLAAAIDGLTAKDEAQGEAIQRLQRIARVIENFPIMKMAAVSEDVVEFLPDEMQAKIDPAFFRQAEKQREADRIAKEKAASARAEIAKAEAEAAAAKLAEIEAASIEQLLERAFPNPYERFPVRSLFEVSQMAASIVQGALALDARFNFLRTTRRADDLDLRIIERLREARGRGEKIGGTPAAAV